MDSQKLSFFVSSRHKIDTRTLTEALSMKMGTIINNTTTEVKENMDNFGIYSGNELLEHKFKKREFLIENLVREKDSIILVGDAKVAKSLLALQLTCSATSGTPFLDRYKVLRESKVSYVQLEGEIEDTQDRLERMIKTLEFNPDFFQLLFYPPLELQDRNAMVRLKEEIEKFKPDILIIDPLYAALTGSLSDNAIVRQFIGNLRVLKGALGCALILIHHAHRIRTDGKTGRVINEGDEALYGSAFFKAWADHLLLLENDKRTEIRTLSCKTQRSGKVLKQCNLRLIEPDPLYFETVEKCETKEALIISILMREEHKEGLAAQEADELYGIKHTTFYESVKKPLTDGVLDKTKSRPVRYFIKDREKYSTVRTS